jgi:hypothetical protein
MQKIISKHGAVYECERYERKIIDGKTYYVMKNVTRKKTSKDGKKINVHYNMARIPIRYTKVVD